MRISLPGCLVDATATAFLASLTNYDGDGPGTIRRRVHDLPKKESFDRFGNCAWFRLFCPKYSKKSSLVRNGIRTDEGWAREPPLVSPRPQNPGYTLPDVSVPTYTGTTNPRPGRPALS
jgi:hypothetical protein